MSVLEGEGRDPILYGPVTLSSPPHLAGYLARPDLAGRHPGVVVVHGAAGLTSSTRSVCRLLARHGYVALSVDLYRSHPASPSSHGSAERILGDLEFAAAALTGDWAGWVDPSGIGAVGLGEGGGHAARLAGAHRAPVVIVGGLEAAYLPRPYLGGPLLGLIAAESADEVRALHAEVGRGEWVRYTGVGPGFHDEGSPDYQRPTAQDAFERLVAFFDANLAKRAPTAA